MRKEILRRLLYRFGTKRMLHGLPVAIWVLSLFEEKDLAFEKLDTALGLIEKYAPEKFRALQTDISSILIAGDPTFGGRYIHALRMVELLEDYVQDEQTTPEALACTVMHEGQHARLYRLGFGYDEQIRDRIERICFRTERNFARLLPNGDELVADAEEWMDADLTPVFSNEGQRRAGLEALKEMGCPDWLIRFVGWVSRRRAA